MATLKRNWDIVVEGGVVSTRFNVVVSDGVHIEPRGRLLYFPDGAGIVRRGSSLVLSLLEPGRDTS